jgi:hypothetical protein
LDSPPRTTLAGLAADVGVFLAAALRAVKMRGRTDADFAL